MWRGWMVNWGQGQGDGFKKIELNGCRIMPYREFFGKEKRINEIGHGQIVRIISIF